MDSHLLPCRGKDGRKRRDARCSYKGWIQATIAQTPSFTGAYETHYLRTVTCQCILRCIPRKAVTLETRVCADANGCSIKMRSPIPYAPVPVSDNRSNGIAIESYTKKLINDAK